MGFLLPLSLLFGLSLPALLIFYLLKVKRRPRRVSSTWLWREAIEDARASVPFQKLRRNLLMFLQLLVLALITLALARPVLNLLQAKEGSTFILIDASASMGMRASAGGPTRLEEAKEKASRLIASLSARSQAAVLVYADRAAVIEPLTGDKSKLRHALDDLKIKPSAQDLKGALSLASSLLASAPEPRVVIFSDSAEIKQNEMELLHSTPTTVEACGSVSPNFGWTAADLRQRSTTSNVYDLFAQLAWFGEGEREIKVEIKSGDTILDARRLKLRPGGETPLIVENLELVGRPIIHCVAGGEKGDADALDLDNEVWLRAPSKEKLRVLFYSPGNYFLSRALSTAGEMDMVSVLPGAPIPEGDFDAAIYDRAVPDSPPAVPSLYIAVAPWDATKSAPKEEEESAVGGITSWDTDHPLTSAIQWSTITVFGAKPMTPPQGTRVLVEAGGVPLLMLGRAHERPALVMGFDIFRSNFPLRSGFPIFVKGAIDWLTQSSPGRAPQFLHGGETFTMTAPKNASELRVVSPDRKIWPLTPGPDRTVSFAETYLPGIWSVEADGAPLEQFAVNLLSLKESDPGVIQPVTIAADGELSRRGLGAELRTNREIWKWLALGALAILTLEWFLYRRGAA